MNLTQSFACLQLYDIADCKGTSHQEMLPHLQRLLKRCDDNSISYPHTWIVDNCCEGRNFIRSLVPGANVYQDAKHIINRLIENLSKSGERRQLYDALCREIHGVFGAQEINVMSRTKKTYFIPGRLPEGSTMWANLNEIVSRYKAMDPTLFLKDFDATMKNQEYHIFNCVKDPLIVGPQGQLTHYVELEDGVFVLLRGTNRNESCHKE